MNIHTSVKRNAAQKEVSGYILDAFGVIGSKTIQKLLALKIIKSSEPSEELVKRMLVHIIGNEEAPSEVISIHQRNKKWMMLKSWKQVRFTCY